MNKKRKSDLKYAFEEDRVMKYSTQKPILIEQPLRWIYLTENKVCHPPA